jgi:hypothetical protein
MVGTDEDSGRSRRPGVQEWGWSHRLGTRWPDDWEVGCAVCTMHKETKSVSFLVEPQNIGQCFVNSLASKPHGRFVLI